MYCSGLLQSEDEMQQPVRTVATVSLATIKKNLEGLLKIARTQSLQRPLALPMVKSDAYGHGLVVVSQMLQKQSDIAGLGVATIAEAVTLRKHRIHTPLWVFSECTPWSKDLADLCTHYKITPVFHSVSDLKKALREKFQGAFHIKINTGLNRLGIDTSECSELERILSKSGPRLHMEGVCTHLAMPELPQEQRTRSQVLRFKDALALLAKFHPRYIHAASTAALPELKQLGLSDICNVIRPGIGLHGYGLKGSYLKKYGILPAMQWKVKILKMRRLKKGDAVGYGASFEAERDMMQAVISCGYGDGLLRSLSNQSISGRRVFGRVSMDLTTIEGKGLRAGSWIKILGETSQQGETLAKSAGTIIYEVLTSISGRVPRVYR